MTKATEKALHPEWQTQHTDQGKALGEREKRNAIINNVSVRMELVTLFFFLFFRSFLLVCTAHLYLSAVRLNRREIFAIYFRILNIAIKYYNLYLLIRTCTIHISVNFILWNASGKTKNGSEMHTEQY